MAPNESDIDRGNGGSFLTAVLVGRLKRNDGRLFNSNNGQIIVELRNCGDKPWMSISAVNWRSEFRGSWCLWKIQTPVSAKSWRWKSSIRDKWKLWNLSLGKCLEFNLLCAILLRSTKLSSVPKMVGELPLHVKESLSPTESDTRHWFECPDSGEKKQTRASVAVIELESSARSCYRSPTWNCFWGLVSLSLHITVRFISVKSRDQHTETLVHSIIANEIRAFGS